MATEAELLALPLEYEHKGKVYKIARIVTFGMEANFADWVYMESINHIERMRGLYVASNGQMGLNDEQYDKAMDRITDRFCAGEFSWGSETVSAKANKTWPGIKYLIFLRMRAFDGTVTLSLVDEIFADNKAREALFKVIATPRKAAVSENGQTEQVLQTAAGQD